MLAKLSTNKTSLCYRDVTTDEISEPYVHSNMWIGYGALKWVYQDLRRCLFYRHRPSDSIDTEPSDNAA